MGLSLTLKKGGRSFIGIDECVKGGECTGCFEKAVRVRASQNPFVTVADFRDRKILPSPSIIRMLMNWKEVMIAPKEKNPVWRILVQIFNQSPDIRLISTNPECLERPTQRFGSQRPPLTRVPGERLLGQPRKDES
jgi:hypothetical protein